MHIAMSKGQSCLRNPVNVGRCSTRSFRTVSHIASRSLPRFVATSLVIAVQANSSLWTKVYDSLLGMSRDERPIPCPEQIPSLTSRGQIGSWQRTAIDILVTAVVSHHQSITARCDCRPMCDATARDWSTDPTESAKVHFGSEVRARREVY